MKGFAGKVLMQSLKRNAFRNGDHKRSGPALRNEFLSIHHDSTHPIAQVAERLVGLLKVLSLICHDESHHILCNENGRALPASVQFLDDSGPLPKETRPSSNPHSMEVASEREVLAGKRRPS
jgi:hypothetical protein